MADEFKPVKPKVITTGGEWIAILVVIIAAIVTIVVIYFILKPKIRQGSSYDPAGPPDFAVSCPTSLPPTNLTAFIGDVAKPSFDASWNGVYVTTTLGALVIGYNIYVSTTPGITTSNTKLAGFCPIPQVRVLTTGEGKVQFDTTYYFKVATVDTCGQGELSTEEFMITT